MKCAYTELIEHLQTPELPVIIEETNQLAGEIFVFMGMGTEGCGTTQTALELAKELSKNAPDKKVLLIDLNLTEPELEDRITDYGKSLQLNLDQIYNLANTGKISGKDITKHTTLLKGTKNLFFVTGTRLSVLADNFNVEVMRALLQAARQDHHYVFIDCSAHFDNAGTVAAVIEGDIVTVVSDYNGAGLRLFSNLKKTVLELHPDVLSKFKILGVERAVEKEIETSIIEEILEIPFSGHIVPNSNEQYALSLNAYLLTLELEHNQDVQTSKKGFFLRLKPSFKIPFVKKKPVEVK